MIVVVGGIKGGSGKTTIATHLAVWRGRETKDVLLVDADDQETATDFTALRDVEQTGYTSIKLSGLAVRAQVLRLKDKYGDIVIDTGGRDTASQRAALSVADLLLVPFVPRSFDVWTIPKVAQLVSEMQSANPALRAIVFLNRADPRGTDNDEAVAMLREASQEQAGVTVLEHASIGNRKAFGNAAAAGKTVDETSPKDLKAIEEFGSLYRYVFDSKKDSRKGRR